MQRLLHTHSTDIFISKQVCVRVFTVKAAIISIYGNFVPRTVKIGRGAFRGRGPSVQINIGDLLLIAGKQNVSVFKFLLLVFYGLKSDFYWVLSKLFEVAVFYSNDRT